MIPLEKLFFECFRFFIYQFTAMHQASLSFSPRLSF